MADQTLPPRGNVIKFTGNSPAAARGRDAKIAREREERRLRMEAGEPCPTPTLPLRIKPLTPDEIREKALETAAELLMDGRAHAVALLKKQISHKDPGIAQRAAIKLLEYTDGKPNQPVTHEGEQTTRIIYETAALDGGGFIPGYRDAESA